MSVKCLLGFLAENILWIASFPEPVFKLSNISNKITYLRTNSFHSQSLIKNNWRFCVIKVTWLKMKVLIAICRLAVDIGDKFIMINFNGNIMRKL